MDEISNDTMECQIDDEGRETFLKRIGLFVYWREEILLSVTSANNTLNAKNKLSSNSCFIFTQQTQHLLAFSAKLKFVIDDE